MSRVPFEGRVSERRHTRFKHGGSPEQRAERKRRNEIKRQGEASERANSQAKHKRQWGTATDQKNADDQGAWRKDYFRRVRPDLDPQSTMSGVMEFFGLDDKPYQTDASSFDYRQRRYDETGDPSWNPFFAPEILNTPTGQVIQEGYDLINRGDETPADQFRRQLQEENDQRQQYGMAPLSEEEFGLSLRDAWADDFRRKHNRNPTEEEFDEYVNQKYGDTRTRKERYAGALLNMFDFPALGMQDEIAAGAMSMLPGRGTYDEELKRAEEIQKKWEEFEPGDSALNLGTTAGGLGLSFGSPIAAGPFRAADAAWRYGRKAIGLAPEAATTLGRAVTTMGSGATGGAVDFTAYDFAEHPGSIEDRVKDMNWESPAIGAVGGGLVFPAISAASNAVRKGSRWVMKGPKPKPKTEKPSETVRDDIDKALQRSRK